VPLKHSKDIFVDNNIAKNFCNPMDPAYKTFIKWLIAEGHLVLTNKIINEYMRTCASNTSDSNMAVIVGKLIADGRANFINNEKLKELKIKPKVKKGLRSNVQDHDHIKAVILSVRKMAVCGDINLCYDLSNFPGLTATVSHRPENVPYS